MNAWELLAGLQALSIYILIRLEEGETEHNNLDSMLQTMVIVSLILDFSTAISRRHITSEIFVQPVNKLHL